jgi:chitinase
MKYARGWLGMAFGTLLLSAAACGSSHGVTSSGTHGGGGSAGSTSGHGAGSTVSTGAGNAGTTGSTTGSTSTGSTTGSGGGTSGSDVWVMGYYASWTAPANGGDYDVSAIHWDGLTHVAAAFYIPDDNADWQAGNFDDATAAALISAAHAHGKKALASIGGADSGAGFEGATQNAMSKLVDNLAALLAMGYDGIDIDWEGGNLSTQQDQELETSLIMALRTKSPNAILTLTAGIENENFVDDLSWYGTIAAQLDRINVMTYGMAGAWQGWESWHSSPLHWNQNGSTPTGIDTTVGHYLAAGVPAGKLGVGAGFYGECYTAPVHGPAQMLGGSMVAADDGTMTYTNIMKSFYAASAYHFDAAAGVPYLSLDGNNAQGCTYVTYEDPMSLAQKGAWVRSKGLGGVILWELSEGYDPSGATVQAQNPLVEVMRTAFLQ